MATVVKKEPLMVANSTGQVTVSINVIVQAAKMEEQIDVIRRYLKEKSSSDDALIYASEILAIIGEEKEKP